MKIKVVHQIMEWNEDVSNEIKEDLKEKKVCLVNVMGSPGAGKTSLITSLVNELKDKYRFGVIEGDIAGQIDAEKMEKMGIPVVQLNTDGACHIEAMSIQHILPDFDLNSLDVIFVENIGNLVCPAEFNIGEDFTLCRRARQAKKLLCSLSHTAAFEKTGSDLGVEVALQQALKATAMTSFILRHLMDGVVDGVQIQSLCLLGQIHLASAGTALGLGTHHQVLLGAVGDDLTQQLGEAGCVVGFLVGVALVSLSDLGVALALSHTGHCQIHADLAALTLEVCAQTVHDLLGDALSLADADDMLGHIGVAGLLHECGSGSLADGALLRDGAFSDITTNGANVLFHTIDLHNFSVILLAAPGTVGLGF